MPGLWPSIFAVRGVPVHPPSLSPERKSLHRSRFLKRGGDGGGPHHPWQVLTIFALYGCSCCVKAHDDEEQKHGCCAKPLPPATANDLDHADAERGPLQDQSQLDGEPDQLAVPELPEKLTSVTDAAVEGAPPPAPASYSGPDTGTSPTRVRVRSS